MGRFFISLLLLLGMLIGAESVVPAPATKDDIRQLIHYMDKRFEAVDKRFEEMQKNTEKRFDMLMWFIGLLTVLSTATIGYIVNRLGRHDEKFSDVETRLQHIDLSALLKDLRSADPAIKKGLKEILK